MRLKKGLILIVFALILGVIGCSSPGLVSEDKESKIINTKDKIIGVSVMNYENEYWNDFIAGITVYCNNMNYKVIHSSAMDDPTIQSENINDFIHKDVAGFIVAAINQSILEVPIEEAMAKDIKVVGHLHDLKNFDILYGPNEYEMGYKSGAYLGQLFVKEKNMTPKIVIFTYNELGTLLDRVQGIEAGLHAYVPKATILEKVDAYTYELGEEVAKDIANTYPELDGMAGINDNGLLGAYDYFKGIGYLKRNDFHIVGIGGDEPTLQAIMEGGAFAATVNIDPWLNGYNEAKYIIEAIEGKNYSNKIVYFSELDIVDFNNVSDVIYEKQYRKSLLVGDQ